MMTETQLLIASFGFTILTHIKSSDYRFHEGSKWWVLLFGVLATLSWVSYGITKVFSNTPNPPEADK